METRAILLEGDGRLSFQAVALKPPGDGDVVVEIAQSGISTGTERLLWSGRMPHFPGLQYPLVPGYEAVGEVIEVRGESPWRPGDRVFVPGADCYTNVRGLFGGSANHLVTSGDRIVSAEGLEEGAVLLALAATAHHALRAGTAAPPELIVGHGALGRLLARLTIALGAPAPTVWEISPARRGAAPYPVVDPAEDPRRDYRTIYDVAGDATILDDLIARLALGGELVLAGFYAAPLQFAFPPAFMREARLRISAEWTPEDLSATRALVADGTLDLGGLITHRRPAAHAAEAYATAFDDPACLKMVLDWKEAA
ncbi:MAG: chlorophyll synthesis pathway protein BchC [Pseudomonadota bacterium]